jgi:HlyD family secretion protein
MARNENAVNVLVLAAVAAIATAWFAPKYINAGLTAAGPAAVTTASGPRAAIAVGAVDGAAARTVVAAWAVAAPGRVEPNGGDVRISPIQGGRILDVLVDVNDQVQTGDLLVRLDDADHEARVLAADAEVNVRRREREAEAVTGPARDRRVAEDNLAGAERNLATARADFDRVFRARRTTPAADVQRARDAVAAARDRLEEARVLLRRVNASPNMPLQTRLESGLAAARTDLSLAEAAYERARIRAPRDLGVLQSTAVIGETAVASPENVLLVLGDTSSLRVRTEIEERDVGKVRLDQPVVVRSDAFPGQEFEGRITQLGKSLAPSKIGVRGPRRGLENDVLEVFVALAGRPPLLPGMRVDVLVKPDAISPKAEAPAKDAPKSN